MPPKHYVFTNSNRALPTPSSYVFVSVLAWLRYWQKKQMSDKKFKLIRTIRKDEDVTKLTARLDILRLIMERHQNSNPDYDYAIVDEQGNPAELADFLQSELAHPVTKAKRVKEEKKEQYRKEVVKRLKRC
jgi:hypothetical protein